MSVYVDDMEAPFGRMIMCHMIADTRIELMEMADLIGVARKWIQHPETAEEHFDIAKSARRKAVAAGAQEITMLECGEICFKRCGHAGYKAYEAQPVRSAAALDLGL